MAEMSSKRYVAAYQRDPDSDAWLVHIEGEPGCQTYGRSLRQAGVRIREALAVWLDREPDTLVVTDRLPAELEALTRGVAHRRSQAERAGVAAQAATAEAVRELAARGLSRRDAAELLGISHQRVQQLLAS
jgi:predicted RNase H-like HicB family nuclease